MSHTESGPAIPPPVSLLTQAASPVSPPPWCEVLAVAHLAGTVVMGLVGAAPMVAVELGLVVLYVASAVLVRRRLVADPLLLLWSGVLIHGVLGTVLMGWAAGFYAQFFTVAVATTLDAKGRWGRRFVRASVHAGGCVLFWWALGDAPAVAQVSTLGLQVLSTLNIAAALMGLAVHIQTTERRAERGRSRERHAASVDGLTGLFNRRATLARARTLRAAAVRANEPVSVAVIEIDRLAELVRRAGPAAGDAMVRGVSGRLEECVRTDDLLGRVGPSEFLMVLSGLRGAMTFDLMDRVHTAIERPVVLPGGAVDTPSLSIGLAVWADDELLEECIARADAALYQGRFRGADAEELAAG